MLFYGGNIMIFDYLEHSDHIYWIFYVLNFIFGVTAYKLGFAKKLPVMKSIFVYILLAIGTYVLTIFSVLNLPMTESLIIVSIVMGLYRFRLHRERKEKQES